MGTPVLDVDRPDVTDAATMLVLPEVAAFARRGGADSLVFVFKSSDQVERLARGLGLTLLGSPAGIARRWENKVEFAARAASLGLRVPAWRVIHDDRELASAWDRSDGDMVIQSPRQTPPARPGS
jgi:hypothetical protein